MQKNKYQAIELFAGIGGFRLGLDAAKIQTIWANDSKEQAAAVYQDRFGCQEFAGGDIHQCIEQIPQHDILTAGFPCQPFSSAGKKQGLRDPRGSLFEVILQILRSHKPRFFALENVKRLLTMERGTHFQGFPDDHCHVASVYDQYALYGNAVPPPMVKWVIKNLLSPFKIDPEIINQIFHIAIGRSNEAG